MKINVPLPNPSVSYGAMISGVRLSHFCGVSCMNWMLGKWCAFHN